MKEKELFNWLKDRFLPDLETTEQFDYKDAYSKKHDLYIELKCRKTHYDDLLIEKIKWDKLIAHRNVRYINWTPIGVFSFNLHNMLEPTWQQREMPKTTEFNINDKIIKTIGYLDVERYAIKIANF